MLLTKKTALKFLEAKLSQKKLGNHLLLAKMKWDQTLSNSSDVKMERADLLILTNKLKLTPQHA